MYATRHTRRRCSAKEQLVSFRRAWRYVSLHGRATTTSHLPAHPFKQRLAKSKRKLTSPFCCASRRTSVYVAVLPFFFVRPAVSASACRCFKALTEVGCLLDPPAHLTQQLSEGTANRRRLAVPLVRPCTSAVDLLHCAHHKLLSFLRSTRCPVGTIQWPTATMSDKVTSTGAPGQSGTMRT